MKLTEIYYKIRLAKFYFFHYPSKLPSLFRTLMSSKFKMRSYYNQEDYSSGYPFTVIIRPTNRCNLRCRECGQWGENGVFNDSSTDLIPNELDTNQWINFIDDMAYFKPYIAFFGGEPFVRPDFLKLVKHASSKGLLTWTSTNGTLLEGKAEDVVRSGLDYIFISLDGPPEINDKIRIGDDVYKKVEAGIKALVTAKKNLGSELPLILVAMTVVLDNHKYILETANIAKNLGVNQFSLRYPIFTTYSLEETSRNIFRQEFGVDASFWKGFIMDFSEIDVDAIKKQEDEVKKLWGSNYRPLPYGKSFDIHRHFMKPNITHGGGNCIVPWMRGQVMPNGDVVLCEDFTDITAGNILDKPLMEIWNGDIYRKFRKHIKEKGIFPACTRCCGLYEIPHYKTSRLPNKEFII